MSADKHRNDQASRALKGPQGAPGQNMGTHVTGIACNCGGCKDGVRLAQRGQVRQL